MFFNRFRSRRPASDGRNTLSDGTSAHLALYKSDTCGYCMRVLRVIDQLGVQVELRDVQTDRAWRADLAKRTGRTTVPCLVINEEPMFESADIIAWLHETFEAT